MSRQSIRTTLAGNRQFVAFTATVLVVLGLFPGSPGRVFLAGGSSSPPSPPSTAPPAAPSTTSAATAPPTAPEPPAETEHVAPPTGEPLRLGDLAPPPPREPRPALSCDTDELFAVVHDLRGETSSTWGQLLDLVLPGEHPDRGHLAGKSLERLVRLVTGCEAEQFPDDPDAQYQYMAGLMIEMLLDLAGVVPNLGIDPILLPPGVLDATDLLYSLLREAGGAVPPEVIDLLGPFADDIRDACGITELLLTLAPILVADSVPLDVDDLTRLMAPLSGVCGLFDDDSFLDDQP